MHTLSKRYSICTVDNNVQCAQLDYGANCKATVGYRFKGYQLNGERRLRCRKYSSTILQLEMVKSLLRNSVDTENTCERALCECDKRLAEKLSYLEDTSRLNTSYFGSFLTRNIQFRVSQQVRRLQLRGNLRSEMSELPKVGRVLRRVPRKIPFFLRLWKQGMLWPKNLLQVGPSVLQK